MVKFKFGLARVRAIYSYESHLTADLRTLYYFLFFVSINFLFLIGNSDGRVAETPTRTLVNPIISGGGQVSTSHTIHSSHASSVQQSGNISALSGNVTPLSATEVVLDTNGHAKTVSVHPSVHGLGGVVPSEVVIQ